jgi:amino acid adenylation domain-containing protein/thioester reductase-like protein
MEEKRSELLLNAGQTGIYLECMQEPDTLKYNIPVLLRLPKGTERERMIEAVKAAASGHEALFAVIREVSGKPTLVIRPGEISVREHSAERIEDGIKHFCRPFDLANGPLCRFEYLHTPEGDALLFDVHHLVFDGSSLKILVREIASLYGGSLPEKESPTFSELLQPVEKDPGETERTRAMLRDELDGADFDFRLDPDQILKEKPAGMGILEIACGSALPVEAVEAFTRTNGISENALFLGSFGLTLSIYAGTEEAVFASAHYGRSAFKNDPVVGMFVRTLPIRVRFTQDESPAAFLSRVYDSYYRMQKNDCIDFSELAATYGIRENLSFVYHAELLNDVTIGGKTAAVELLNTNEPICDLEFTVRKRADGYAIVAKYRRSMYTDAFMKSFADTFLHVAAQMRTADRLGMIEPASEANRALIDGFNRTENAYDTAHTVVDLFRMQAQKTPDAECVVYLDKRFTYREVDAITDRLAKHLVKRGVGRGSIVGIMIPRCEYMPLCSMGVLKSGAAYLPMDPSYPTERLNQMLSDSGASYLITTEELTSRITDEFKGERMTVGAIPDLPDDDTPLPSPSPEDLFIVLYTSGSTGKPKGVMFRHANTMVTVAWGRDFYGFGPGSRFGVYASFGFDANVFDTYPILTSGAALYIIPEELRLDLYALQQYFNENGITNSIMTTQVGTQFLLMKGTKTLRTLSVAGEKLVPVEPPKDFRLYNLYGPTEGSVLVTAFPVDRAYEDIPIGHAVDNVKLYIVDRFGRLVPPGAKGELWITGPHVTAGYLNDPEKTEKAYVNNPFCPDAGYERAYRTGDRVRFLMDGNIQFVGRGDSQVKIRGFRVELKEVEEVIRRFDGIRDATVADFTEPSGGKFIAAYVVADTQIDIAALNAFIRSEKPDYMVPAVTMQIERIPLNQNQKVNKKALPYPERQQTVEAPPENEAQQKVFDLAAEAIGHGGFGVDTNLPDAGLTSVGILKLNVLLSEKLGLNLKIADLKRHDTVRKLADLLSPKEEAPARAAQEHAAQNMYPLSSVQQGVYVECLASPNSTAYNIPLLLKLDPSVDAGRLKNALTAAIDAHPYLKARLTVDGSGKTLAERHDTDKIEIEMLDRSDLHLGFSELVRPFKLTDAPLVRVALIRDRESVYLFFDAHHLVFDGESLVVFLRDLNKAYGGEALETERYTGFDVALEEEQLRRSSAYADAKAYYTALLDGLDPDCLPVRDKNDAVADVGLLSHRIVIDRAAAARTLSKAKTTENALLNAAFGFTLAKFLARTDCVYTTVYNGRNDARLFGSVGMFVHTLPVVCDLSRGETGNAYVSRIGRQLSDSMANDVFSFAEISRTFDVKANVLFVYEGAIGGAFTVGGRPAEQIALQPDDRKAPLTFFVFDTEDGFRIDCEYETEHYEEWNIRSMLESMDSALAALLRDEPLNAITLLKEEHKAALAAFNRTEKAIEDTDIASLFRRSAKQYPDRTALICGDVRMRYSEVDDLSDRIAAYAKNLGIGPEDVVSILIPRSTYMAVTALGALKAGAAYQPLDPSYPSERLQYMIGDANAKLLIADENLLGLLPDYKGPVLLLKDIAGLPEGIVPESGLKPENLFILLYTSGTTGKPKGVMLTHRNLVNFCDWYRTNYALTPDSVVAAYASFGFDANMMDMYPALTAGAAVCIVPEDLRIDLPLLNDYYKQNGVTHVFMTTQMGRLYAAQIRDSSLMHLSVGGEKLVPIAPPETYTLTNGYGPTECTVFSTTQPVDRLYDRIPIGTALSNYKLYVADGCGHELPVGAMGELWIAGFGVGRGYLNLPERTAAVFTPNPFCSEPGFDRVFRTGDIVRRLRDGRIDFIGRNDGQVKIRGFRIELAEVEGVIRDYPGIRDVTVQAFEDEAFGGKFIAAYVVSDAAVDFGRLSDFIRSKKPSYMIPAAFMQLDAIPLNQNQKVNKRALPKPQRREETGDFVEPATPLEKEICEKYASILGLERVSATDSFFDIGGSSISVAEIVMFAMNKGYPVVYKDVFANPSARELARVIVGLGKDEPSKAAADFDYTAINELISVNSMEYVDGINAHPLGNVILTGATGFLGVHVLYAYLKSTNGKITCLIRRGRYETAEKRMKVMLMYYFGEMMPELFGTRIFCVDGDITMPESLEALEGTDADTVINCAACVKHFAKDDILDRINVGGVENLIDFCVRSRKRLVQVSTLSVGGEISVKNMTKLRENRLYFGQNVDNDYVRTKFLAERAILNARVNRGLDAVILRVGNLMGRHTDGEFQINFETNAFMRALWAYIQLGEYPVTILEQPAEFSPIDSVANAVLTLAGADSRFSVFHVNNNHTVTMADLMAVVRAHGFDVRPVSEAQFRETLKEATKHESESRTVLSLVAYSNKEGNDLALVEADHRFTVNALFRLGFKWPIIDDSYLERVITSLDSFGFFTEKD